MLNKLKKVSFFSFPNSETNKSTIQWMNFMDNKPKGLRFAFIKHYHNEKRNARGKTRSKGKQRMEICGNIMFALILKLCNYHSVSMAVTRCIAMKWRKHVCIFDTVRCKLWSMRIEYVIIFHWIATKNSNYFNWMKAIHRNRIHICWIALKVFLCIKNNTNPLCGKPHFNYQVVLFRCRIKSLNAHWSMGEDGI